MGAASNVAKKSGSTEARAHEKVTVDELGSGRRLTALIHLDHVMAVPHERQRVGHADARDARDGGEILAHPPHARFESRLGHAALAREPCREVPFRRHADLLVFDLPGRPLRKKGDGGKRDGDRDLRDDEHGPDATELEAAAARAGLTKTR